MRIGLFLAAIAVLMMTGGCSWFQVLRGDRTEPSDVIVAGEPGPTGPSEDVTPDVGPVDDAGIVEPLGDPVPEPTLDSAGAGDLAAGSPSPDAAVPAGISVPELSEAENLGPVQTVPSDRVIPVGGVIARVNGTALYTDEVLRDVRPILRARAQTMERERYRVVAEREIRQQLERLIGDEVRLSQARRVLNDNEREFARQRAFEWRRTQVTEAGGSFTEANRRAKQLGFEDLDAMVERKFDQFLIDTYVQRKLLPRIQVSPSEMRLRYQQIVDDRYTEQAKAEFRLLRINESAAGGPDAALTKARDIKARIDSDELDFLTAAGQFNDDAMLRESAGDLGIGLMERGAYRYKQIEDAVFAGEPGQTLGPLPLSDRQGPAQVLVFVEQKTVGRVQPFADAKVQQDLRNQLRQEKYTELLAEEARGEQAMALVERLSDGVQTAVDIALLDYDRWNAEE
ncbi:MAG: peptidylprolyl isomerase [Planctomycetota bacterium]